MLAEPRRQGDVLEQGEIVERTRDLVGAPDTAVADAVSGQSGDLGTGKRDRPCGRLVHAGDAVEDRALAGAIGTDEAENLSLGDGEGDVGHGEEAVERFTQSGDGQQGHRSTPAAARASS